MTQPSAIQLQDLRPDGKIARPGFYQIEMERHHAQPCDGVSVTSGVLRRMIAHGPFITWAHHPMNPNSRPWPDSDAMRLGRAMATVLELGVEGLNRLYKVVPENAPPRPTKTMVRAFKDKGVWSKAAQARVDWWEEFDARPGEQIAQERLDLITAMAEALVSPENLPLAKQCLGGIPELDMAWKDGRSGLWCLSRLDNTKDDGTLIDFKLTNPGVEPFDIHFCDRKITKLGYYNQLAFGAEGWQHLTGHAPTMVGCLFQSVKWPHPVIYREVQPHHLELGMMQNRWARKRFAECLEKNDWPGPGRDVGAYQMPTTVEERILREMGTISTETY